MSDLEYIGHVLLTLWYYKTNRSLMKKLFVELGLEYVVLYGEDFIDGLLNREPREVPMGILNK